MIQNTATTLIKGISLFIYSIVIELLLCGCTLLASGITALAKNRTWFYGVDSSKGVKTINKKPVHLCHREWCYETKQGEAKLYGVHGEVTSAVLDHSKGGSCWYFRDEKKVKIRVLKIPGEREDPKARARVACSRRRQEGPVARTWWERRCTMGPMGHLLRSKGSHWRGLELRNEVI